MSNMLHDPEFELDPCGGYAVDEVDALVAELRSRIVSCEHEWYPRLAGGFHCYKCSGYLSDEDGSRYGVPDATKPDRP